MGRDDSSCLLQGLGHHCQLPTEGLGRHWLEVGYTVTRLHKLAMSYRTWMSVIITYAWLQYGANVMHVWSVLICMQAGMHTFDLSTTTGGGAHPERKPPSSPSLQLQDTHLLQCRKLKLKGVSIIGRVRPMLNHLQYVLNHTTWSQSITVGWAGSISLWVVK